MSPACDVAVGVWLNQLVLAGQADRSDIACLVDILIQFHNADIIVYHCSVVAWMEDDGPHWSGLHETWWMIKIANPKHYFPDSCIFSPLKKERKKKNSVKVFLLSWNTQDFFSPFFHTALRKATNAARSKQIFMHYSLQQRSEQQKSMLSISLLLVIKHIKAHSIKRYVTMY